MNKFLHLFYFIILIFFCSECVDRKKYMKIENFSTVESIYIELDDSDKNENKKTLKKYNLPITQIFEIEKNQFYGKIKCISILDSSRDLNKFGIYSIKVFNLKDSSLVYHFENNLVLMNKLNLSVYKLNNAKESIYKIINNDVLMDSKSNIYSNKIIYYTYLFNLET